MRVRLNAPAVAALCFLAACGGERPPAPAPDPGSGAITVTGRERLEWDQQLGQEPDLSRYRFAAYVDSARTELSAASCRATDSGPGLCSSPLPTMAPGQHVLELVSYLAPDGADSARSNPITVIVATSVAAFSEEITPGTIPRNADTNERRDCAVTAVGGQNAIAALATGELRWVDLRTSRFRSLDWELPQGAWELRAVTVHPQFPHNRWLYVLVSGTRPQEHRIAVVRYRELNGVLGERAVLIERALSDDAPRPRLRFGPDGTLFVALLEGARLTTAPMFGRTTHPASPFLLRFNEDGTLPRNHTRAAPIATGSVRPSALDWDTATGELWTAGYDVSGRPVVQTLQGESLEIPVSQDAPVVGLRVEGAPDARRPGRYWFLSANGVGEIIRTDTVRDTTHTFSVGEDVTVHDALAAPSGEVLLCGSIWLEGQSSATYVVRSVTLPD